MGNLRKGWGSYSFNPFPAKLIPIGLAMLLPVSTVLAQPSDSPVSLRIFPNALPGKQIRIWKHWDAKAGTYRLASNSDIIRTASDLTGLETAEWKLRKQKWGATSEALQSRLERMEDSESVDVTISMKYPEGVVYMDKTRFPVEVLREQSMQIAALAPSNDVQAFLASRGIINKGQVSKESAIATLTKSELKRLMFENEISSIDPYFPGKPTGTPAQFSTLASSAYNHSATAVPSTAGAGVNAGTLEQGIYPDFLTCIGIDPSLWYRIDHSQGSEHGVWSFQCLHNSAPGANLWHRNVTDVEIKYDATGNESWIINNGIQTMSMSVARQGSASQPEFIFMDDFAYRWPYPVFCNPTGNDGFGTVSNFQCYNAISVGNVRHTGQTTFELTGTSFPGACGAPAGECTQTKNPPPVNGYCISGSGADCPGDREMPYLVAPGHSPTNQIDNCLLFNDGCQLNYWTPLEECGTSWSAPIVNGIAADVIAADSRMSNWPEKVRAALMVTAQNVVDNEWSSGIDGKDGAGVVYGSAAVAFAQNHAVVSPNGTPVRDGIGTGVISAGDFAAPNNPIVYKIAIPSSKPYGQHLRVVLTWDSNPVIGGALNALSDLDLSVVSGSTGNSSTSYDGNVEVVDIPSTMFSGGSTIDARISKWANRIPSGSRENFFYYAIAWTWVGDHAP